MFLSSIAGVSRCSFETYCRQKSIPSRFEVCISVIHIVGFCLLFASDYGNRLPELCNFMEGSVVYDWAVCTSVEHKFDFQSTIFLAVSSGKVEGIHMKTWFEVTFVIRSRRLQKFKGKKPDRVFTTTCPWSSMIRTELEQDVGKLLLCGKFLLYWVSEFSGRALKLYWVCWQLSGPLFRELLDLFWWYCLSGFGFVLLSGLKPVCRKGIWLFWFPYLGCWLNFWLFSDPKLGPLLFL